MLKYGFKVCLLGLFLLASCSDPATDLIGSEPLASYVPQSGVLIDETSSEGGSTLGKPNVARLIRTFETVESATQDDLLEEILASSELGEWSKVDEAVGTERYLATKQFDDFELSASVMRKDSKEVTIGITARNI